MTESSSIAIRASGSSKRFGDFTALDGLELAVGRGVIFGLLGPNVAARPVEVRRRTGYVPQLLCRSTGP